MRVSDMEAATHRLQHTLHTVWHYSTKRCFGALTTVLATHEDEDEPAPSTSSGTKEHIIGTSGESETLDPRMNTLWTCSFLA